MKQVIAFLSVLAAVLVLCAWLMAADSIRMSSLVKNSTRQIRQLQSRIEKDEKVLEENKKQSLADAEKLKKMTAERDELQMRLTAADENLNRQTAQNKLHLAELAALSADYQTLAIACVELETKLAHSADDNALAAASFDQQRAEDAKKIAELERALAEALHAPQLTPFIPIRYRLPMN